MLVWRRGCDAKFCAECSDRLAIKRNRVKKGALDRCTPPSEAMQFHNALLERGVESVLVTYPEEGHGVRKFPAVIDYTARLMDWFEKFMPAVL